MLTKFNILRNLFHSPIKRPFNFSTMKQSDDNHFIPAFSIKSGHFTKVKDDISYYTNQIVNVIFLGTPDDWVLVDAGMPKCGAEIFKVAEEKFGAKTKPKSIVLTHGHFDHVGGIVHLLEKWNVPVYAHSLEFPFLNGQQSYPEPDPTVEGGLMAKIASIYPSDPIDIAPVLKALPADNTVPDLPGWKWVHTPGHAPGHVSLWRESDRALVSGDAIVSVKQDSLYRVLMQKEEVNGPPVYFTIDWEGAKESVLELAALKPEWLIPGHGQVMQGKELEDGLKKLADHFEELAVPSYGKYVHESDKK